MLVFHHLLLIGTAIFAAHDNLSSMESPERTTTSTPSVAEVMIPSTGTSERGTDSSDVPVPRSDVSVEGITSTTQDHLPVRLPRHLRNVIETTNRGGGCYWSYSTTCRVGGICNSNSVPTLSLGYNDKIPLSCAGVRIPYQRVLPGCDSEDPPGGAAEEVGRAGGGVRPPPAFYAAFRELINSRDRDAVRDVGTVFHTVDHTGAEEEKVVRPWDNQYRWTEYNNWIVFQRTLRVSDAAAHVDQLLLDAEKLREKLDVQKKVLEKIPSDDLQRAGAVEAFLPPTERCETIKLWRAEEKRKSSQALTALQERYEVELGVAEVFGQIEVKYLGLLWDVFEKLRPLALLEDAVPGGGNSSADDWLESLSTDLRDRLLAAEQEALQESGRGNGYREPAARRAEYWKELQRRAQSAMPSVWQRPNDRTASNRTLPTPFSWQLKNALSKIELDKIFGDTLVYGANSATAWMGPDFSSSPDGEAAQNSFEKKKFLATRAERLQRLKEGLELMTLVLLLGSPYSQWTRLLQLFEPENPLMALRKQFDGYRSEQNIMARTTSRIYNISYSKEMPKEIQVKITKGSFCFINTTP